MKSTRSAARAAERPLSLFMKTTKPAPLGGVLAAAPPPVLPPALSEFKGHKLVVLNPHERFPLQFGLGKARLIVANIAAIQAFVASGGLSVA